MQNVHIICNGRICQNKSIVSGLSSSIFDGGQVEYSYYYTIIFSILYLSAIVEISTSLILKELRNNQKSLIQNFSYITPLLCRKSSKLCFNHINMKI